MSENNTTANRKETEFVVIYIYIIDIRLDSLLAVGGISFASLGPIVEKWSLKALKSSLELEIIASFNFSSFSAISQHTL